MKKRIPNRIFLSLKKAPQFRTFDRVPSNFSVKGLPMVTKLKLALEKHPDYLTQDAVRTIDHISKSNMKGNKVDLRSPFSFLIPGALGIDCDLESQDSVCKEGFLSIINRSEVYTKKPEFRIFEQIQSDRLGNTSSKAPFTDPEHGLLKSVLGYFEPDNSKTLSYVEDDFVAAVNYVKGMLPGGSLTPDPLDLVADKSDKTTQHGLPFLKHGNDLDPSGVPYWQIYKELAAEDIRRRIITPFWSMLFCRVTPNGTENPNQRAVWGIAHSIVLIELTFQSPALRALLSLEPFSELKSQEDTDAAITELFKINGPENVLGVDFSGYDKSIIALLIRTVYGIIAYWFHPSNSDLISQLSTIMCSCDLITPIGLFEGRTKSVASGMASTNLVDCLVQLIIFHYVRIRCRKSAKICFVLVNGDDGVWFIPGLTSVMFSSYVAEFGLISKPEKCTCSPDYVQFCQRLYMKDYFKGNYNVGIRSANRALSSIIRYERRRKPKWRPVHDSIRCLMQLENLKNHPSFKEITYLLIKADTKFGLGSKLPGGVAELCKLGGSDEDVSWLISNSSWERTRNVEKLQKIHTLEVVQLIDSQRLRARDEP